MEHFWVTLLVAVGTAIFPSGCSGSVLHGIAGGQGYLQLIPHHELVYTNIHSPYILSQLNHGVRIDETHAVHQVPDGNGQGQEQSTASVDETLAVSGGNGEEPSPAPVFENSADINKNKLITQEELYQQLFGTQSEPSEENNAIEDDGSSRAAQAVLPLSEHSNGQISLSVVDLLKPQNRPQESADQSADSPTSITPSEQNGSQTIVTIDNTATGEKINASEDGNLQLQPSSASGGEGQQVSGGDSVPVVIPELPASDITSTSTSSSQEAVVSNPEIGTRTTAGEVNINAEQGRLQMQASLSSAGEGLKVSIGDAPKLVVDSVPVIISSELPASVIKKDSHPHSITNVNVNVNVNGDGRGSIINSTAVAEITAPIKIADKKCD